MPERLDDLVWAGRPGQNKLSSACCLRMSAAKIFNLAMA